MNEGKKDLTDKVTKKTNELSDEELDKVSGGLDLNNEKQLWQADLAKSLNPNGFGATFDEWKQLQQLRGENSDYGEMRCYSCGSWKTVWHGITSMQCWECKECEATNEGWCSSKDRIIKQYGAKGVSIYFPF